MHISPRKLLSLAALISSMGLVGCQPKGEESDQPPPTGSPSPSVSATNPSKPEPVANKAEFGLEPTVKSLVSETAGEFDIIYEWKVSQKRDQDWRVFVHFTYGDGAIAFQNDHHPDPPTSQWEPGVVQQGPFTVRIPEGTEGIFNIRMGLFQMAGADLGTSARAELDGNNDGEKRYIVGQVAVTDGQVEFTRPE